MIYSHLTFFILGMIVGGLFGAFVVLLFQAHIELVADRKDEKILKSLGLLDDDV